MPHMTLPDGDRLYYEVHGSGPALLLVSGLSGLSSFWSAHVAELARAFRVIVHDHRGTGQSSIAKIRYSVEQMAADVLALMDHLDVERAHLVGHSTGGAIGQVLGIEQPARIDRLGLSSTWAAADGYFRHLFKVRSKILKTAGPAVYAMATELFMKPPAWFHHNAPEQDMGGDTAVDRNPDIDVALARIDAIVRFDRKADLKRIQAPTLITCARDDMVTPVYLSEELAELIPGARTELYASGGHFFPRIHAEEFRRVITGFLLG